MGGRLKILFMVSVISFVGKLQPLIDAEPQIPCYFIFGDSLADDGNNNDLETLAKCNYQPYGIDFPFGPTGRFTNGRTVPDIIGQLLGFERFIPPFATAGRDVLRGVNYASGGGGIHDETGTQLGEHISMNKQLQNHQTIVSRIANLLGSKEAAANYLHKCIYSVGMGINDYANSYLLPQYYHTSSLYTPDQYAAILVQQYSQQLRILHQYGAKKVAIYALGQLGCFPAEIAIHGTNGSSCVDVINNDVQLFNVRLKSLVDDLNNGLPDAKFIYINVTKITSEETFTAGLTVTNVPCCNVSSSTGLCVPNEVPCSNRNTYEFWDAFHPTEIVNTFVAARAYNAQLHLTLIQLIFVGWLRLNHVRVLTLLLSHFYKNGPVWGYVSI